MPSQNRQFKDDVYAQFARIGLALAAPKRLEILDLLIQGPRTVEVLAKAASASVANTSRHLQVLRQAGLVQAEKQGQHVLYRTGSESVAGFYAGLRQVTERHSKEIGEITRRYLQGKAGMEPVDRKSLLKKVREGSTVLLDVRPAEEFKAGHIAGSRHVPLAELADRLSSLPKSTEVVAYCRGPYCVMAVEAVQYLRKKGYRAFRLEDSVWDWKEKGLPVEAGS